MGLIISLAVGAIIGWLIAILTRADRRHGALLHIVLGILGALLGAFFLGPIFGGGNVLESTLDIRTLYVALAGAIGMALLIILVQRRRRRPETVEPFDPYR